MLLLPAIDLMEGQVVRLEQGKAERKTVYSSEPEAVAQQWESAGGDWLHLVDLDAAFTGELRNLEAIRQITSAVSIPCEAGGGLRSLDAIEQVLGAGVTRVIVGTRAAESIAFVKEAISRFGPEKIVVGVDAKEGFVSVRGWTESSGLRAIDLVHQVQEAGVRTVIYTDIATDGMLRGPNFREIENLLEASTCEVIASGGVSSLSDLEELAALRSADGQRQVHGAITGKAIYDGRLDLAVAAQVLGNSAQG